MSFGGQMFNLPQPFYYYALGDVAIRCVQVWRNGLLKIESWKHFLGACHTLLTFLVRWYRKTILCLNGLLFYSQRKSSTFYNN